jgi:hypothetical protein
MVIASLVRSRHTALTTSWIDRMRSRCLTGPLLLVGRRRALIGGAELTIEETTYYSVDSTGSTQVA